MTSCRRQSNFSSKVTQHDRPIVLRPVMATPCLIIFDLSVSTYNPVRHAFPHIKKPNFHRSHFTWDFCKSQIIFSSYIHTSLSRVGATHGWHFPVTICMFLSYPLLKGYNVWLVSYKFPVFHQKADFSVLVKFWLLFSASFPKLVCFLFWCSNKRAIIKMRPNHVVL